MNCNFIRTDVTDEIAPEGDVDSFENRYRFQMGQPVWISEKFHSTNEHFTKTRTEPRSGSVQHIHQDGVFVVQKAVSVLVSSVSETKKKFHTQK